MTTRTKDEAQTGVNSDVDGEDQKELSSFSCVRRFLALKTRNSNRLCRLMLKDTHLKTACYTTPRNHPAEASLTFQLAFSRRIRRGGVTG